MKRLIRVGILLSLAMVVAVPQVAVAKPQQKDSDLSKITHYTLSVSVDDGPFKEVASGSDMSMVEPTPEIMAIASAGSKSVTYRNTAWSLVQPIYYLDHRLSWGWSGSSCSLISRGYSAYAYPGNGWSCYRLNSSSWGGTGTSCLWSKYQYTFKYNGTSNGIPIIFFKNLGLQVNGYAGGSSSATKF